MKQVLYHISEHHYPEGHQLGLYDLYNYREDFANNTIIDRGSPYKGVQRGRCFIAFKTLEQCDYYANSYKIEHPEICFYFYRIEVESSIMAPYAVVECLNSNIVPIDVYPKIVSEYWKPSQNWHMYEYLFQKATIIQEEHVSAGVDGIVKTQIEVYEDVGDLLTLLHQEESELSSVS